MDETNAAAKKLRPGPGGLLLLNGLLLALLAAVTFGPSAGAQIRVPANYTMAAGDVKTGGSAVLYVVDTTNRELIALKYDYNTKQLAGVGYRNLGADVEARLSGRR